jgi:hypothetical protein
MKNEILKEHLIKSYGFDATFNLCFQLEADRVLEKNIWK